MSAYPVATIAKLLCLTERRVQQLSKEGVIPRDGRGEYDLAPAVQGYVRYLQERLQAGPKGGGANGIDYHAEKARKTRAEADLVEMDAALRRGDLVSASEVAEAWQTILTEVRTKILNMPQRLGIALAGVTDEAVLKATIAAEARAVLAALADTEVEAAAAAEENADEEEGADAG